jgi:hypothetical protein
MGRRFAYGWFGRCFDALALTVLALGGGAIAGLAPSTITGAVTIGGAAWFLMLVLVVTPCRMWLEQAAAIVELQSELKQKGVAQEKLDALWALRASGVKIRNERIKPDEHAGWVKRFVKWREEALDAASRASPNLRSYLDVLNETRNPPAGVNPVSSEHALQLRILSEIIARIEAYLAKHT